MSININPTGIYTDYEYSSDGEVSAGQAGIFIPLASLPGFTAAEANEGGADSDYRKLIWTLLSVAEDQVNALDSDSKPEKMTLSKSGLTFVDEDTARRSYTASFNFAIENLDVEDEDS